MAIIAVEVDIRVTSLGQPPLNHFLGESQSQSRTKYDGFCTTIPYFLKAFQYISGLFSILQFFDTLPRNTSRAVNLSSHDRGSVVLCFFSL